MNTAVHPGYFSNFSNTIYQSTKCALPQILKFPNDQICPMSEDEFGRNCEMFWLIHNINVILSDNVVQNSFSNLFPICVYPTKLLRQQSHDQFDEVYKEGSSLE